MYSNRPQLFQMSFWTCRLSAGPAAEHSALDLRRDRRASAPNFPVRGRPAGGPVLAFAVFLKMYQRVTSDRRACIACVPSRSPCAA